MSARLDRASASLPALNSADVVDGDAIAIGELYERSNSSLADAVAARLECGRRLMEKKASMAHGAWLPWLEANADVLRFSSRFTAAKLIKAAQRNVPLAAHLDEPTAVKLSRQMWGHGEGNHRTINTGENEWYTPPEFIDLARRVMGGIDLDPASSEEANETVGATRFFTQEDDGLAQEWTGRVWLNPPYSRDLMPLFIDKLKQSYISGNVSEALLVSHNSTDTNWFHSLSETLAAICFPARRIKFYRGDHVAGPTNGQMFIYLGDDIAAFWREFHPVGYVVIPA